MAQNIGLVITLGGVEKVISSIEELESAINSAREKLIETKKGSDAYKNLSTEIDGATTKLKDLKKQQETLNPEKYLVGLAQVGGSITQGFAAATAAVGLFGGNTEAVAQAAARAQNLLTIAISARGAAEGLAGLKTVALTVKTIAQTAATTAATTATRAFYTTLAANPMGAVLATIGLVITALIAFTSNTKEATDANDELEKSLERVNLQFDQELALLQAAGADEITIQQKRIQRAEELAEVRNQEFLEQQRNNRFSKETEAARIEAIKAEGQVEVERQNLVRLQEKRTEDQRKTNADNAKKRADERKAQIEAEIALQGELTRAELARELAGREIDPVEFNNELQKRLDLIKKLVEGYQSEEDALTKYNNTLGDVYDLRKLDYEEQKKLERQLLLLGKATGLYNKGIDAQVILTEKGISGIDSLGNIIETSTLGEIMLLTEGVNGTTQEFIDFDTRLTGVYNTLKLIRDGFFVAGTSLQQLDLTNIVRVLNDFEEGDNVLIDRVIANRNRLAKFQEQFVADYIKNNLKLKQGEVGYAKALEESRKSGEAAFALVLENTENFVKFERATFKASATVTELNQQIVKLANSGPALNAFLAQNRDLITQSFSVDLSKLEENRNALLALDRILATKQYSEAEGFRTEILELEKQLAEQGIDISKASDEEKLKLLRFYLGKEVEATEEAEVKKRTEFQKTLSTIENYISQFQGLLNSVSQLVADYYSLQLQELEIQNKAILDQVVGDTEAANAKRLEQQKIYEAQREELEKEATKKSLQIQLAQAVANTAQAITRVFAQEGTIGFITAGLVAAANAIQIGLIQQQLSAVSSFQRGGWIKGQGGLVVGPSHEQGGVKYAQGGVELEGGEAVINRMSTLRYAGLLNSVNMSQGGKPIMVNNSFDDSRLLEALAKQKSEPIRAYVLEGDITSKQNVTKRLEQLSSF